MTPETPPRDGNDWPTSLYARMASPYTESALVDVANARFAQVGRTPTPQLTDGNGPQWLPVSVEARRVTDELTAAGVATFLDLTITHLFETAAEDNPVRLREELTALGGLVVEWIEGLDAAAEAREYA